MPSAAEQLAANFSFSNLGKSQELRNRIFFTLGALIVAVAQSVTVLYLGNSWSDLTVYVILLLVLAIRPNGLLGRAEVQRV